MDGSLLILKQEIQVDCTLNEICNSITLKPCNIKVLDIQLTLWIKFKEKMENMKEEHMHKIFAQRLC